MALRKEFLFFLISDLPCCLKVIGVISIAFSKEIRLIKRWFLMLCYFRMYSQSWLYRDSFLLSVNCHEFL